MFTGIIQALGKIQAIEPTGVDSRFFIKTGKLDLKHVQLGDSIAVNGVCLTVVELHNTQSQSNGFWADVSAETLTKTAFKHISISTQVNLEKAVLATTHLGGHIVSGHVDGVGKVVHRSIVGRSVHFKIQAPDELAKYIAAKGSICVNGISLTVNEVNGHTFDLNIVPHTLEETTLNKCIVGSEVNLEVDIISRYLERLLLGDKAAEQTSQSKLSMEILVKNGFA